MISCAGPTGEINGFGIFRVTKSQKNGESVPARGFGRTPINLVPRLRAADKILRKSESHIVLGPRA